MDCTDILGGLDAEGLAAELTGATATILAKVSAAKLGALRSLSAEDKAKVQAVAKEKGVAEAVKMAAGMKKV